MNSQEFKPLIISTNNQNYFEKLMNSYGYDVASSYKGHSVLLRNFRKLWFKFKLPYFEIWYNKEIIRKKNESIIVFDSLVTISFLRWLKKNKKKTRIIFWYWNPVRKSISPNLVSKIECEIWSYSKTDCFKYSLRHNNQFHFKSLILPKLNILHDVFFLGRDKGRLNMLLDLKEEFEKQNLDVNFHIVQTNRRFFKDKSIYSNLISYDKALEEMAKSKAILDILSNPNDDLSLRAIESIFYRKKLITNCLNIVNYDFYNPLNIFVIGKDNINNLYSFINSPYHDIDLEIISQYDFANWVKHFE